MSKEQFIIEGKCKLGHRSSVGETIEFVFEKVEPFGHIEISATLQSTHDNDRHFTLRHEPMVCGIEALIEWLQENKEQK